MIKKRIGMMATRSRQSKFLQLDISQKSYYSTNMKVTITFDDGTSYEGENVFFEFALNEAARNADMLEEGQEVRILSKEQQQLID
jgi:hypothetical protein